MSIIDKIEQMRKEKQVNKKDLCNYSSINVNMYARYLNGSKIPFEVVNKMIEYLDCKLIIVSKYEQI